MKPCTIARISCLVSCLWGGCAGYTGAARPITPAALQHEAGWIAVSDVPLYRQEAEHDCGPTALAMVLAHYGAASIAEVRAALPADQRVSAGMLREQARAFGFDAFVVAGTLQDIKHELLAGRPVIVGVAKPIVTGSTVAHYQVVVGMHQSSQRVATLDPAVGWQQNTFVGFMKEWMPTGFVLLVVLPASPDGADTLTSSRPSPLRPAPGLRPTTSFQAATPRYGPPG